MHVPLAAVSLLALTALAVRPQDEPPPPAPVPDDASEARGLFLTHCAPCHGENGDGKGTTELDRPARSFRDGGFSFGNTPEAIFRTLGTGIPGSPMPGFESALDEAQRRALAAYVVTLGPPAAEVDPELTELRVEDQAVFVRGMLPPLTEKGTAVTRGLALGLPSGQSFEYRTDDVRLLGVRQGRFVRRSDWTGRGGSGLEPLGQVVFVLAEEEPLSTFVDASGAPLHASFTGTWIEGEEAGLAYDLVDAAGVVVAHVKEAVRSRGTRLGSGFTRRFALTGTGAASAVSLREPRRSETVLRHDQSSPTIHRNWTVARIAEGRFECRIGPALPTPDDGPAEDRELLPLREGVFVSYEETRLLLSEVGPDLVRELSQELAR